MSNNLDEPLLLGIAEVDLADTDPKAYSKLKRVQIIALIVIITVGVLILFMLFISHESESMWQKNNSKLYNSLGFSI